MSELDLSWPEKRLIIIDRDAFCCLNCGTTVVPKEQMEGPTANVHHQTPRKAGGDDRPSNLVTICKSCHNREHNQGPYSLPEFCHQGRDWAHESVLLTTSMNAMLDWFAEQPCACATIGHIADEIGYSHKTVKAKMKQLLAADCAELRYKPTGFHRLIEDPRYEGKKNDQ